MREEKTDFSFLEKAFVVVAWLVSLVTGCAMPVSIVWKPLIVVAVFAILLAGWMLLGNIKERKNIWGCFILTIIFFSSWFGYSQGETSGHRFLSALAAGGLAVLAIIVAERAVESVAKRGEL